ncbi:hypothetical protein [Bradyrhizobium barranii]
MITYDRTLKAVLLRLTVARWGIGADIYRRGVTLWLWARSEHAWDIGETS